MCQRRPCSAGSKGFTLIELLVVIAIIAILAAILFPVFTSAKAAGNKATCMSNQKQIVSALLMFSQDNGERMPAAYFNSDPEAFGPGTPQQWKACVKRYLKTPKVFLCPADKDRRWKDVWSTSDFTNLNYDAPSSYRYNNTLVGRSTKSATPGYPLKPYSVGSIIKPTQCIVICESKPYTGEYNSQGTITGGSSPAEWNQVAAYAGPNIGPSKEDIRAQVNISTTLPENGPVAFDRHGGGANYGFADGHVKWMKWQDTWRPSETQSGPNCWNGCGKPAS